MAGKRTVVHGVGVNDANYIVVKVTNGVESRCPIYRAWVDLLSRCYSESRMKKFPTYKNCSVCEEWLRFSNFKAWMEKQDWKGKHLDKDILRPGNKIYSPDACAFVCSLTNGFVLECSKSRGEYPIGVSFHKATGKFVSQVSNPFTKKKEHLGLFIDIKDAHKAWKKRKHELACQLADLQDSEMVANALRVRYAN